jgi:hypothetical protein
MKKLFCAAVMACMLFTNISIAQKTLTKDERMHWWREARFGMLFTGDYMRSWLVLMTGICKNAAVPSGS